MEYVTVSAFGIRGISNSQYVSYGERISFKRRDAVNTDG